MQYPSPNTFFERIRGGLKLSWIKFSASLGVGTLRNILQRLEDGPFGEILRSREKKSSCDTIVACSTQDSSWKRSSAPFPSDRSAKIRKFVGETAENRGRHCCFTHSLGLDNNPPIFNLLSNFLALSSGTYLHDRRCWNRRYIFFHDLHRIQ